MISSWNFKWNNCSVYMIWLSIKCNIVLIYPDNFIRNANVLIFNLNHCDHLQWALMVFAFWQTVIRAISSRISIILNMQSSCSILFLHEFNKFVWTNLIYVQLKLRLSTIWLHFYESRSTQLSNNISTAYCIYITLIIYSELPKFWEIISVDTVKFIK